MAELATRDRLTAILSGYPRKNRSPCFKFRNNKIEIIQKNSQIGQFEPFLPLYFQGNNQEGGVSTPPTPLSQKRGINLLGQINICAKRYEKFCQKTDMERYEQPNQRFLTIRPS